MCQEHGAWKIIPFPFSCGTLWETSQDAMLGPTSEMFISWICLRRLPSIKGPCFQILPQGYTRVEIQPNGKARVSQQNWIIQPLKPFEEKITSPTSEF